MSIISRKFYAVSCSQCAASGEYYETSKTAIEVAIKLGWQFTKVEEEEDYTVCEIESHCPDCKDRLEVKE